MILGPQSWGGAEDIVSFNKLYAKLEYIESSETQYIDTGFIPNQDTRVVCNVIYETPAESSSHYLFGAREGNGVKTYGINVYGGVYQSMYGNETADGQSGISTKFVIDKNKNIVTINTTTYTQTYTEFTCPVNMYLFAMNNNGSAYGYSSAKLYSCQIYDNETLIRDFIPVKRKADSEIGLYDKVTKTFFGNMGSGSFT